ncbi:hypothetical protein GCM10011320_21760 [Neoroseomonas lacus]|uniref:Uncharacterized protein n=1 Tax=Neoroseomonas lacus TaxID=287609 RepID=A0A917KJ07_9PROT|nr:hypothetical protein GCM10011320_21760 [Neoroseomonas lacus]
MAGDGVSIHATNNLLIPQIEQICGYRGAVECLDDLADDHWICGQGREPFVDGLTWCGGWWSIR